MKLRQEDYDDPSGLSPFFHWLRLLLVQKVLEYVCVICIILHSTGWRVRLVGIRAPLWLTEFGRYTSLLCFPDLPGNMG